MESNRDPSDSAPDSARIDPTRRALLGATGVAVSALAGCLGLGASGSSGGSGASSGGSSGAQGDKPLPAPVQGDPKASVTVAVYEDFACPHCRTYNLDVLPELESKYIEPGKVRYEHHDFPVVNDASWQAASAARAVQDRAGDGPFFTYAGLLYENQSALGPDTYASLADQLDLDGQAISDAGESRAYEATVQANYDRAGEKGINATPTVLVDGKSVSEPSVSAISSAIESAK